MSHDISITRCTIATALPADLEALAESWELHLRAERKSSETIRSYLAGVEAFLH